MHNVFPNVFERHYNLFFVTSAGTDESVSHTKLTSKVTAQPNYVPIGTRSVVMYPEMPFSKPNDPFYLDFKRFSILSSVPQSQHYTDNNSLRQQTTVLYSDTTNKFQLDQPTYIPALKMASKVKVTLNDSIEREIIETRVISPNISAVITNSSRISNGLFQLDVLSKELVRDL